MNTLQRYLNQIRTQLNGLTMSQKLLIGLLAVVMAATIYGVVLSSAKPEMVELLPGTTMKPEEAARVKEFLAGKYTIEVTGDKIMVPAEKAYMIRGELAANQALPRDTTVAFAKLAEANDFLHTGEQNERLWNLAKQTVLSKVISNFPGISEATVIINKGERHGLGSAAPSSAMVNVVTRGDPLGQNTVLAIVDTVCGAVNGMRREDVRVTDGARSYRAPSEDTPMPADLLAYKNSIEEQLTQKLMRQLEYIPDVKVAVNVVPDMSSKVVDSTVYDPKVVKAEVMTKTTDQNTSEGTTPSNEPGVRPNVGVAAASSSGGTRSTTSNSDSTTTTDVRFPETKEKKVVPAGTVMNDMTASISVPRSYFVKLLQERKNDPKFEPAEDDKMLASTMDVVMKNIQAQAKNTIGAKTDEQIRVDYFYDFAPANAVGGTGNGTIAAVGTFGPVVGQYAKQGMLVLMAVGAMMMMLMMAKKAAPVPAGVSGEVGAGEAAAGRGKRRSGGDASAMDVGDDVYGEANQGEAVLTGIELDDETLKSRKMVDEVSTMIKENPENAAGLVKRWLIKGK